MTNEQLLDRYVTARTSPDLAGLRSVLADDLHFEDPLDTSTTADAFVAAMGRLLAGPVRGIVDQQVLVDGDRAAVFSTWETAVGPASFAERITIEHGRISVIRAYFDPRPFART